jgi:putative transposase
MLLVESHNINPNHEYFSECDKLCRISKLLYNEANYLVRQSFISNNKYISAIEIKKQFQTTSENYKNLPAKVSSETLRLLHQNWLSFFKAIKDWKKHPEKYLGRPKIPKYKKVFFPVIYDRQAISTKTLKQNIISLSQTNIKIPLQHKDHKIKQARIIPVNSELFKIEVVFEKEIKQNDLNKSRSIGIDFGLNNLIAATGNTKPFIITGKPLKSINQWYNKEKAKMQSRLPEYFISKRMKKLSNKRNNKINDYLHKTSNMIIKHCLANDIGNLVIGYNKEWKQNINIGKKNNQAFVNIPFYKLLSKIAYKAELQGISVVTQEESYTSKCSWIDNERIAKHVKYKGKRVKRGLFRTENKILVNADINAAANILKKCNSQFNSINEGIEAVSAPPVKLNPYKQFSI